MKDIESQMSKKGENNSSACAGTSLNIYADLVIRDNKSVFMQVNKKIESDSIYDN